MQKIKIQIQKKILLRIIFILDIIRVKKIKNELKQNEINNINKKLETELNKKKNYKKNFKIKNKIYIYIK